MKKFSPTPNVLKLLLTTALIFILYFPVRNAPLLWDDENFISNNPSITTLDHPISFFTTPETLSHIERYNTSIYRPIRTLGFAIQHHFFGNIGSGYHYVSIVLHLLIVLLVGAILGYFMPPSLAFTMSLIWGVHPFHTEAVSFVSSQGDLLCALFFLGAFLSMLKSRWICFSVFYVLTLFSKEIGLGAFLIHGAGFFLLSPLEATKKKNISIRIMGAGFLFSLAYLLWRSHLLGRVTQIDETGSVWSNLFFLAPKTLLAYFGAFFYPFSQNALYGDIRWKWVEIPLVMLFSWAGWILFRKRSQDTLSQNAWNTFLFGSLWFLVFLSLISNIIPISISFAERFLYLPSIGLVLAISPLISHFSKAISHPMLKRGFALCILLALAGLTLNRNTLWTDELALFHDTVQKSPKFRVAHMNYIQSLFEREKYSETIQAFEQFENNWSLPPTLSAMKMESLCRERHWKKCTSTALTLLQHPKWGHRAAKWIIHIETRKGNITKVQSLKQQFCDHNPTDDLCQFEAASK